MLKRTIKIYLLICAFINLLNAKNILFKDYVESIEIFKNKHELFYYNLISEHKIKLSGKYLQGILRGDKGVIIFTKSKDYFYVTYIRYYIERGKTNKYIDKVILHKRSKKPFEFFYDSGMLGVITIKLKQKIENWGLGDENKSPNPQKS